MFKQNSRDKNIQNFDNQDLTHNLVGKSLFGGAVTIGGRAARVVILIGGTAVLARILDPEDFGLVAMVTALTGFCQVFMDAGLSVATIQREKITHHQVSTIFWIISAISFCLMLTIFAASPAVAWFYDDDRLIKITLAFGVSIFLGGLGIQHRTLLRREMRFGLVAGLEIGVQVAVTLIGIALALLGIGYWALVGMHALRPLIMTPLLWYFCSWRPGLPRRGTGVRPMIAFGGFLSITRVMDYLVKSMDNILIGSLIGSYSLGLYTRAYSLIMMPITQINYPASTVVTPALSRLQDDPVRYRKYYNRALFLNTLFAMPVVILTFVAAEEIVLLFLGEKWTGAVPLLRALIPATFIYTFNGALGWALTPLGKTKQLMKVFLFEGVFTIVAFFIGIKWGALGVATALSVQTIVTRPFSLWYTFRNSVVKFYDVVSAVFRPALASLLAGGVLYWLKTVLVDDSSWLFLFVFAVLYFLFFAITWVAIPGGIKEIRNIIRYVEIMRSSRKG